MPELFLGPSNAVQQQNPMQVTDQAAILAGHPQSDLFNNQTKGIARGTI